MSTRTDIHCPSKLNPSQYEYVGAFYHPGKKTVPDYLDSIVAGWLESIDQHMRDTGGKWANHKHGGTCMSCGAHAKYLAVFYHQPSNEYIATGFDCAVKIQLQHDQTQLKRMKKSFQNATRMALNSELAIQVMENNGTSFVLDWINDDEIEKRFPWFCSNSTNFKSYSNTYWTVMDIAYKVQQYGQFSSDRQQDLFNRKVESTLALTLKNILVDMDENDDTRPFVDEIVESGEFVALFPFADWLEENIDSPVCELIRCQSQETFDKGVQWFVEHRSKKPIDTTTREITGEVISVKHVDSMYGGTLKVTVQDDRGFRVYGTLAAAIDDAVKGDRITFRVANVKASNDDAAFGFFQRPTRAAFLHRVEREIDNVPVEFDPLSHHAF